MKNNIRTKLEYRCCKSEEFDYLEKEYFVKCNRSYDMFVTASTKEDCECLMSSFEEFVAKDGFQVCFDSNLEPEYNKEKNTWVGAVEIYIDNDDVTSNKEYVKELYREWKKSLKDDSKQIKIERVIEPEFEEDMYCIEYSVDGNLGYEYIDEFAANDDAKLFKEKIKNSSEFANSLVEKPHVEKCSNLLADLIENCRQSDNEMWFVDYEDLEELFDNDYDSRDKFLEDMEKECKKLNLDDYIEFNTDCAITVYGGVITQFLF